MAAYADRIIFMKDGSVVDDAQIGGATSVDDVLRRAEPDVDRDTLLAAWPVDQDQAERALESLLADGLARLTADGYTL